MDLAHIEVVAAKFHTHTIPSCAANTEPQNSLLMLVGLVVKSMADHAQFKVYEEPDMVWGDQNSRICSSVFFFECKDIVCICAYICHIPLIKYP